MPDLDAAIRAKLKRREHVFPGMGGERRQLIVDWCEAVEAVVLAVLELHKPNPHPSSLGPYCEQCEGGYEGRAPWPCPTVLAIAEKLGIEAGDA